MDINVIHIAKMVLQEWEHWVFSGHVGDIMPTSVLLRAINGPVMVEPGKRLWGTTSLHKVGEGEGKGDIWWLSCTLIPLRAHSSHHMLLHDGGGGVIIVA